MRIFALLFVLGAFFLSGTHLLFAQEPQATPPVPIHFFGRDDCKFCNAEKEFLAQLAQETDVEIRYYNIIDDEAAKELYLSVTEAVEIPKITPVTLVGYRIIQGFDSPQTTGVLIKDAVEDARVLASNSDIDLTNVQELLSHDEFGAAEKSGSGCDEHGETCGIEAPEGHWIQIPFYGPADLDTFSLLTLSVVLGIIDGFNPCAMWVLVTFIIILSQIGDRRKMLQLAGLFLLAQAILYYLILTVWFTAWDFVGLDAIVTPLVGILALFGGAIFLRKFYKDREVLTCDVTDLEQQGKITRKIREIAEKPMSLIVALSVIGIAFSVNIIEFACSIGIPQAFTKILELNNLGMLANQGYMLVFMIFYMIDDIIVLSLALWGIGKLHQSHKLSLYSSLIGGILMIILGLLLVFAPDMLVF